jgi:hypothetical protein
MNIFEIPGTEIFGKGGGYDFGGETLREPRGIIFKRRLSLKDP